MGLCSGSQASRRADRAEIALQVLCDAFVFCGDALLVLFAFLALFGSLNLFRCLELFGSLDLCGRLDLAGCRATHDNYRQQSQGAAFPHVSSHSLSVPGFRAIAAAKRQLLTVAGAMAASVPGSRINGLAEQFLCRRWADDLGTRPSCAPGALSCARTNSFNDCSLGTRLEGHSDRALEPGR